MRRLSPRAKPVIVAACAATLAAPAAALAGPTTVSVNTPGSSLVVRATGSEANSVTVTVDSAAAPTALIVVDNGPGATTSDSSCMAPSSGAVSCPLGTINRVDIALGNRDDVGVISPAVPARVRGLIDGGDGNDSLFGGLGNADLNGGSDGDSLFGGFGSDDIDAGAGNDSVFGGAGNDDTGGGAGDDYLDGGPGGDLLKGGSNSDTVSYVTRTEGVAATIGGPAGQDGNSEDSSPAGLDTIDNDVENLWGTSGDDVLAGDNDANLLAAGAGNDFLLGNGRGDTLVGDLGDDFLAGGFGNDVLNGGFGRDRMFGGPDADRLRARDRTRDRRLNCGPGRFDKLKRDGRDPRGKSCKRKRRR